MSLNAYIIAYQLKMVLNAKPSYSKTEKYDTKNNYYIINVLLVCF